MNGGGPDDRCVLALLATGTELVDGRCTDTNSPWVESRLREAGWSVVECRQVGDDPAAIRTALEELSARVPVVVVSGGLGPTEDDRTRDALAHWSGAPLVEDPEAWTDLQAWFAALGRSPSPSNRRQALRPGCAVCLANPLGTAPGLRMSVGGTTVYALPGVPREFRAMVADHVLPDLKARAGPRGWQHRRLQVVGLAESAAGELLAPWMAPGCRPELCLTAHVGSLTVTLWDQQDEAGARRLQERTEEVRSALGRHCFGEGDVGLAEVVLAACRAAGRTLSVAESCTGGRISAALTSVPGSSAVFLEGCVTYSNEAKTRRLGVPPEMLQQHGAVSKPVALGMARGVRQRSGSDLAVATTGIAGPEGGSPERPVGTVWFAVADAQGCQAVKHQLPGDREQVQTRAVMVALDLLRRHLERGGEGESR